MIVVDASVFIHVIMETGKSQKAAAVLKEHVDWIAPELVDLEVLNGVRKPMLRGDCSEQRAQAAIEEYSAFRIGRLSSSPFQNEIWGLRHNLTPYDASYVVIAKEFNLTFLTCDAPLHAACRNMIDCILV
jgi:predicted nucleic acid-binding protein